MNIYTNLNKIITYIEENLEDDIDYDVIAKMMNTNEYTAKKVFPILAGISFSEYIRNRRLSNAGFDIYIKNEKVIDVAIKYHYDNPTSFSRAFEKFHGIKPSDVKVNPDKLKVFPRLQFNEDIEDIKDMEYSIIQMEEKILYGKGTKTTETTIGVDAPRFFAEMRNRYLEKYGEIDFGIVKYENRFESPNYEYWIAYDKQIEEFEKIVIPKSKWIKFEISSQKPEDIQRVSKIFYDKFIPSSKYTFKSLPELEYYHNDIDTTDFLIPIED